MPAQELYSTSPPTIRITSPARTTAQRPVAVVAGVGGGVSSGTSGGKTQLSKKQQRPSQAQSRAQSQVQGQVQGQATAVANGSNNGSNGDGNGGGSLGEVRQLLSRLLPKSLTSTNPGPSPNNITNTNSRDARNGKVTREAMTNLVTAVSRVHARQDAQEARLAKLETKVSGLEDAVCILASKLDDLRNALDS